MEIVSDNEKPAAPVARIGLISAARPIAATFSPQPDITAYEIAVLIPWLLVPMTEADYEALGNAQRHVKRLDRP